MVLHGPFNSFDLESQGSTALPEEIEIFLVKSIVTAIKHTRKFFLTRKFTPTLAEQVGEFVNGLRREMHGSNSYLELRTILNVDMWNNIAKPSSVYTYKWDFPIKTENGNAKMSHAYASKLCHSAIIMAQEKTIDEEFLEINKSLNDLLKETSVLTTLTSYAKDLNTKASVVVDNLCSIAENLEDVK